jgi:hypothetical protein
MKQAIHLGKKQVGVAIALALAVAAPAAAFAAGMPGAGTVTRDGGSAPIITVGLGTVAAQPAGAGSQLPIITGLKNGATITLGASTVIQWGGAGAPKDTTNSGGFNVLAGNTLTFAGAFPVLNVDDSGNTSIIAGKVTAAANLFIANANGVTVTPGGTISAPMVGLIGADLATTATTGTSSTTGTLLKPTKGPQVAFAAGTMNIAFASGGNMTVDGTINNSAGTATNILIAGSGSVNVNATNLDYSGKSFEVLGGTGFNVNNAGSVGVAGNGLPVAGTKTKGILPANAYATTNVSLTNAAPTAVFADGNLTFSGYSTLPTANANVGWTGSLVNTTGSTLFTPSTIKGAAKGPVNHDANSWYGTKNATGSGYKNTPVGSIVNNGLLQTVTTGLTTVSNGFTNTGTLRIGTGGGLTITSDTGAINLGGTVQGSNSSAGINSATLKTTKSGNINVSAPLTISGSAGTFTVSANKTGNVSVSGALTLTSTNSTDGQALYNVTGNNISLSANQTISNSTATNSTQPDAVLTLNGNAPGTVTIGAGSTLTAGDVTVTGGTQALTNLVADGNITTTNYADAASPTTDGRFTFTGNSITGSGAGSIAAQMFDLKVMGNVRKSAANLTNNFWTNGLVLTSEGAQPNLNLYTNGIGRQFINLRVSGNITANSATVKGPDYTGPQLSGTGNATSSNANALSQLMLMSTGNITINGGGKEGTNAVLAQNPGAIGGSFYFPGLTYFGNISGLKTPNAIGAGSIVSTGSVNNAVGLPVGGGQGLYFMTKNLTIGGSLFTNMNSYVNFGTAAQSAQYANSEYAVSYSSVYTNTLNMAPPAGPIGNVYTIPAK